MTGRRRARVADAHELAAAMPHVRVSLTEVVQDAWLAQASTRRAEHWLAARPAADE